MVMKGFLAILFLLVSNMVVHAEPVFINDSIATSPDATEAGVAWLKADLSALILDGADTGVGDFNDLVETLKKVAPKTLVVLVKSPIANKFLAVPMASDLNTVVVQNYEMALDIIFKQRQSGTVLFSPGGKSFNRFDNYTQRGKFFKNLVLALNT